MGNGLAIERGKGYGGRFRPGLTYPTIYDLEDDDAPINPPPTRGERIFAGVSHLFFGTIGAVFALVAVLVALRGDVVGALLGISAAAAMLWMVASERGWSRVARVAGWMAASSIVTVPAVLFAAMIGLV